MNDIDKQIADYPKCKDRIEDQLKDRESYLAQLFDAIDNDLPFDDYQYAHDALYEYPLGISKMRVIEVQISTGGPGDWIEIFVDEDGFRPEITKVKYHFNDWFDHAEMSVEADSPMYRYAESVLEMLSN